MPIKSTLFAVLILACSALPCRGQASPYSSNVFTTQNCPNGVACPMLALPGTRINICQGTPANLAACVAATTYTNGGAGTPCPTTAQLVNGPGGPCVSSTDPQGNILFWGLAGQYSFFETLAATAGGGTYGPYPVSIGASAGCPSNATCDVNYATLPLAFAAAGSGTLYITKAWNGQTTATYSSPITFLGGGVIQPANSQTITLSGSIEGNTPVKIFDLSAGGTIAFTSTFRSSGMYPENWGAVGDGSTDDVTRVQACYASVTQASSCERVAVNGYGICASQLVIDRAGHYHSQGIIGRLVPCQTFAANSPIQKITVTGNSTKNIYNQATGFIIDNEFIQGWNGSARSPAGGILIEGVDSMTMSNYQCYSVLGSCLTIGSNVGPVRESFFYDTTIAWAGSSTQPAMQIVDPTGAADANNELNFYGTYIYSCPYTHLFISKGSNSGAGPRFLNFFGWQFEGGSISETGSTVVTASDIVYVASAGFGISFIGGTAGSNSGYVNGVSSGYALFRVGNRLAAASGTTTNVDGISISYAYLGDYSAGSNGGTCLVTNGVNTAQLNTVRFAACPGGTWVLGYLPFNSTTITFGFNNFPYCYACDWSGGAPTGNYQRLMGDNFFASGVPQSVTPNSFNVMTNGGTSGYYQVDSDGVTRRLILSLPGTGNTTLSAGSGGNVVAQSNSGTPFMAFGPSNEIFTGLFPNGPGYKSTRTTSCQTASGINSLCNTTITWPTGAGTLPFPDAMYTVSCIAQTILGVPQIANVSAVGIASIVVTIQNLTGVTAQAYLNCIAIHD